MSAFLGWVFMNLNPQKKSIDLGGLKSDKFNYLPQFFAFKTLDLFSNLIQLRSIYRQSFGESNLNWNNITMLVKIGRRDKDGDRLRYWRFVLIHRCRRDTLALCYGVENFTIWGLGFMFGLRRGRIYIRELGLWFFCLVNVGLICLGPDPFRLFV
jgi:hypothetical protein